MWGIDKNNAYYRGNKLEGADVKTLALFRHELIAKAEYSKDDKSIFYEYRKIKGADVKTFKTVNEASNVDYDAFDKNRKYQSGEPKD